MCVNSVSGQRFRRVDLRRQSGLRSLLSRWRLRRCSWWCGLLSRCGLLLRLSVVSRGLVSTIDPICWQRQCLHKVILRRLPRCCLLVLRCWWRWSRLLILRCRRRWTRLWSLLLHHLLRTPSLLSAVVILTIVVIIAPVIVTSTTLVICSLSL